MKRFWIVCLAVCSITAAGGCSQEKPPPTPELSADGACIVKYKDEQYGCNIRFLSKDVETITVNSPAAVKGMTFRSGNGKFSISYSSLICRSDSLLLPEDSFPKTAARAVHDFRSKSDTLEANADTNGYTFSNHSYTLKTDPNGIIKEILLKQ